MREQWTFSKDNTEKKKGIANVIWIYLWLNEILSDDYLKNRYNYSPRNDSEAWWLLFIK